MSGYFPTRLFESQINFVKFLQFHPCADPMPILVETFFPCALRLAIDLYLYDVEDVAREVMRGYPKGGVGKPAARTLRHSFKKGDDKKPMARRQVKAVEFSHRPAVQQFTKFLFNITDPIEKVGFAMLFYNSVDQFFYNWTTLLVRRGYCELPALTGPLQLKGNPGSQFASNSGLPVSLPIELVNRAGWAHGATAAVLPPGTYVAIFQCQLRRPTPGVTLGVRLALKEGSYPVAVATEYGASVDVGADTWTTLMVSKTFGSPSFLLNEIWWECTLEIGLSALFDIQEASITIWQEYTEISY